VYYRIPKHIICWNTKLKGISANLRGMESKELLEKFQQINNIWLEEINVEETGGYGIVYESDAIEAELKRRKVKIENWMTLYR
jgi:hypothetical protein